MLGNFSFNSIAKRSASSFSKRSVPVPILPVSEHFQWIAWVLISLVTFIRLVFGPKLFARNLYSFFLRKPRHQALGSQQQPGDGGSILEGRARDLFGVHHASLDQVF